MSVEEVEWFGLYSPRLHYPKVETPFLIWMCYTELGLVRGWRRNSNLTPEFTLASTNTLD